MNWPSNQDYFPCTHLLLFCTSQQFLHPFIQKFSPNPPSICQHLRSRYRHIPASFNLCSGLLLGKMTKEVSDHSIYAQGPFANTKIYMLENMRHWIRGLKNTKLRSQEPRISKSLRIHIITPSDSNAHKSLRTIVQQLQTRQEKA